MLRNSDGPYRVRVSMIGNGVIRVNNCSGQYLLKAQ